MKELSGNSLQSYWTRYKIAVLLNASVDLLGQTSFPLASGVKGSFVELTPKSYYRGGTLRESFCGGCHLCQRARFVTNYFGNRIHDWARQVDPNHFCNFILVIINIYIYFSPGENNCRRGFFLCLGFYSSFNDITSLPLSLFSRSAPKTMGSQTLPLIHPDATIYFSNNTSSDLPFPTHYPWYYVQGPSMIPGIPDNVASLLGNVLVYWIVSLIYHALDISGWAWLEKYRMQPSEDDAKKNLVTRAQVVKTVAWQQIMQTTLGYFWMGVGSGIPPVPVDHAAHMKLIYERVGYIMTSVLGDYHGPRLLTLHGSILTYSLYWWAIPILRFALALYVMCFFNPPLQKENKGGELAVTRVYWLI